jgi:hypothetical protein
MEADTAVATQMKLSQSSGTWEVLFSPEGRVGGVGQTQAWMPTYVSILRILHMI